MKQCRDLKVAAVEYPATDHVLLKLESTDSPLPAIRAGQFVEVKVEDSPHTFLRRPISVNYVDTDNRQLWLLIHAVGEGTRRLMQLVPGDMLNVLMPLGNGFSTPTPGESVLLVGGGVGTAPLLEYGHQLLQAGATPIFLLGGRTADSILQLHEFEAMGQVFVTTEDGSMGARGFVTDSPLLAHIVDESSTAGDCRPAKANLRISTCGPTPMMRAVARWASSHGIECEVSLENMMACGLGACLCCVEPTVRGHVCICTEGPVFNIKDLTWQI